MVQPSASSEEPGRIIISVIHSSLLNFMKLKFNLELNPFVSVKLDSKMIDANDVELIRRLLRSRGPFLSAWCFKTSSLKKRSEGMRHIDQFLDWYVKNLKVLGAPEMVKLLKSFSVALQKSAGRDYSIPASNYITPKGVPVYLDLQTRNNLVRGDARLLQFFLTLFGIYRILQIPGELKLSTITSPFTGSVKKAPQSYVNSFGEFLLGSKEPYSVTNPSIRKEFHTLFPIWKSSSFGSVSWRHCLSSYLQLPQQPFAKEFWSLHFDQGILPATAISVLHLISRCMPESLRDAVELTWLDLRSEQVDPSNIPYGWLSTKVEPAGKIRVFAMVDYMSQVLLRPFHDFLFSLLRGLPTDGTFDQGHQVRRIRELRTGHCFSFDLSAATDRLPVDLQVQILSVLASPAYARAWKKFLVGRSYWFNLTKELQSLKSDVKLAKLNKFTYAVGQPMGALSSWASLAVTHHFLIWWACCLAQVEPRNFVNYSVLGDDICIWDVKVAKQYLHICKQLGVEINLAKSIVSHQRRISHGLLSQTAVEFAKRTLLGKMDISPFPFKLLLGNREMIPAIFHLLVEMQDFNISRILCCLFYPYIDEIRRMNKTKQNLIHVYNYTIGKRLLFVLGQLTRVGLLSLREYLEILSEAATLKEYASFRYLMLCHKLLPQVTNPENGDLRFEKSKNSFVILKVYTEFMELLDRLASRKSLTDVRFGLMAKPKGDNSPVSFLMSNDVHAKMLIMPPTWRIICTERGMLLPRYWVEYALVVYKKVLPKAYPSEIIKYLDDPSTKHGARILSEEREYYSSLWSSVLEPPGGAGDAKLFADLNLQMRVNQTTGKVRGRRSRVQNSTMPLALDTLWKALFMYIHVPKDILYAPWKTDAQNADARSEVNQLLGRDLEFLFPGLPKSYLLHYAADILSGIAPSLEELQRRVESLEMLLLLNRGTQFQELQKVDALSARKADITFRANTKLVRMMNRVIARNASASAHVSG
jgi:hypothetical protein